MAEAVNYRERNKMIVAAHKSGVKATDLARQHDVCVPRIYEIIRAAKYLPAREARAAKLEAEKKARRDEEARALEARLRSGNLDAITIDDAEMSFRSTNALSRAGFKTMGEVARATDHELLRIQCLGRKSLQEIRYTVSRLLRGAAHD